MKTYDPYDPKIGDFDPVTQQYVHIVWCNALRNRPADGTKGCCCPKRESSYDRFMAIGAAAIEAGEKHQREEAHRIENICRLITR